MINTENKLIYILLNYEEKQSFLVENLKKEFFENWANAKIFEEAKNLYKEGQEIDSVIIADKLKNEKITEHLMDITIENFASSVMAKQYAEHIFRNYLQKLIKNAKTEKDYDYIAELKQNCLFEEQRINHISYDIDNFDKNYSLKEKTAVYSLYSKLDNCIGSFMGGDYIALGASTGMGKTTIALNLARQICMQEKTVLYFSLEMPLDQLQNRFVCIQEKLNANKYRTFGFNQVEMNNYIKGLQGLKEWNLYTVCDFNLTLEKMRAYIERQKRKGLNFVILDYLGLMSGYANKSSYERITMFSRKIKLMAGEFNVPILVIVQLNRDLKQRQNKRPLLSDIRESGAIEQDADFVLFAHREGVYNPEVPKNKLELLIAKNRHGESNKILEFNFDLETQTISE